MFDVPREPDFGKKRFSFDASNSPPAHGKDGFSRHTRRKQSRALRGSAEELPVSSTQVM
jgi:hypothetical protein